MRIYSVLMLIASLITYSASAQVYPYAETFENYTAFTALNGNGGIVSTSHIQVYSSRGLNNSKCAEFQMTPFGSPHYDTMTGPLIGPLTANSVASFYFRVVTYTGATPLSYPMTSNDKVELFLGNSNFSVSSSIYTITSANQNTNGSYVKVSIPVASFAGITGKYRFVASNPSANDWIFELDSVVVNDATTTSSLSLSDVVTNVKCKGQSNGSIKVIASGGSTPYTYHWNTGGTLDSLSAIAAGGYSVTVTDHAGASAVLSDSVHQPELLNIDSISKANVTCFGAANGSATVHVSGGTGSYHYAWTPSSTSQSLLNIAAGNYALTVTDDNGCTTSSSVVISQPTALSAVTTNTSATGMNGTATVVASGGTPPYIYHWSSIPAQTTSTATGLAAGNYSVTVTDQNGCTVTSSTTILPNGISNVNELSVILYPNPAADKIYFRNMRNGVKDISIYDLNGRLVSHEQSNENSLDISALSNGEYVVKIGFGSDQYQARFSVSK